MLFRPRKLYKIGEVMRYTGLSRQTVHNYTCMGLITETERTESNHRLYPEDVFERLETIEDMKRTNTLLEIKEILDRKDAASPPEDDSGNPQAKGSAMGERNYLVDTEGLSK